VHVAVPAGLERLRVSLLEGESEHGTVEIAVGPRQ
jgi:hypothetical protein